MTGGEKRRLAGRTASVRAILLVPISLGAALALGFAVLGGTAQQGAPQEKPPEQVSGDKKDQGLEIPNILPKGKKLVLKDGSFHLVREYARKGDRVRYYSVERSAWEEIPTDLVDWEATNKAEAAEEQRQREALEKIRAVQAAERAAAPDVEVDASVEVAPGVFLPGGEGMFVVEGRNVSPLTQAAAEIKRDKGRLVEQVLVPVPVVPTRFKVQVPGKRAALRINTAQPEFYMRTADAREPEMELIRAEIKGDKRQIGLLSTNIAGEHSEKRSAISIQRWRIAKGLYRFTLSEPLHPGEYALAEILPDGMNLFVWDFGVDESASRPASPHSSRRKPETPSGCGEVSGHGWGDLVRFSGGLA
ncbi:MAG TPA: hypothetical protein VHM88_06160 [Candidatus Acidoferrales bacterium]|nr:hypothetical protein [Candidatus Acidoferrales bacterium]